MGIIAGRDHASTELRLNVVGQPDRECNDGQGWIHITGRREDGTPRDEQIRDPVHAPVRVDYPISGFGVHPCGAHVVIAALGRRLP